MSKFKLMYNNLQLIDENGPFDGILAFSQGTIMARIILKLNEFKSKVPKLIHEVPKFGIKFSGIFTDRAIYFPEYDKDGFKLMLPYEQPMFYSYGERDTLVNIIEKAIVSEGDATIVKHKYSHNIPRFINEDMKTFGNFLKRVYHQITAEHMEIDTDSIDETRRKKFYSDTETPRVIY